MAFDDRVYLKK